MSPPTLETVIVTVKPSGVCLIELNRPHRGNAFNAQVSREWDEALKWAIADEHVKIIVQTGRGKYYTTGMDISPDLVDEQEQAKGDTYQALYELLETMINSPKPLIAAVNGSAIGILTNLLTDTGIGVTSLGLNDLIYAVPHATFHTPFMRWGLAAEGCSSVTFPMYIGHPKSAALLIAGEVMTAEELYIAGLITKVIPADGFMEKVMEIAERMAGYSQSAIRLTRELLRGKLRTKLHEANLRECQALRERSANNDALPNILAFIEEAKAKKTAKAKARL